MLCCSTRRPRKPAAAPERTSVPQLGQNRGSPASASPHERQNRPGLTLGRMTSMVGLLGLPRSSYPRAMESAECSVPLAPRLLMKTTLRVMRTHRATTTAPASQERRKRFCSDSIRTSHMVEAGPGGQPSEHPRGAFDNVLPLGSVLDHGPIPERVKQIPGVRVLSVLRRTPSRPTAACGPKGIRTPDLLAASQTLYQLSYGPAGGSV